MAEADVHTVFVAKQTWGGGVGPGGLSGGQRASVVVTGLLLAVLLALLVIGAVRDADTPAPTTPTASAGTERPSR